MAISGNVQSENSTISSSSSTVDEFQDIVITVNDSSHVNIISNKEIVLTADEKKKIRFDFKDIDGNDKNVNGDNLDLRVEDTSGSEIFTKSSSDFTLAGGESSSRITLDDNDLDNSGFYIAELKRDGGPGDIDKFQFSIKVRETIF